ncbi:MAG TPA: glycerol-3-phosphate dehydrogenase/oxidase, partial [Acidimicrobiales bacterium]|nr:glycerol-3-phosphate dehydrogenase/oxidase [Acidimicrobiales bacterium]
MERTKARWRSRAAVAGLPAPVAAEALSPWRRSSDIEKLCAGELDILVVGGGVVGAGAALDATTRGFATGLIEARDWASGTSSRSTKLVHGGLRYLQMLDFRLVREALKERDLLLRRLAPHLVRPVPVLYPLRNYFFERVYVGAGVALYDLLGWSIGGSRELPRHRHLSKRSTLEATPGLRATAVTGAVRYYDAQVDDARLVLELVRTAVSYGATAQNRMRLTGFLRAGSRVSGARVTDTETGQEHEVRARVTVVATGAWTEETEALALEGNGALVRPSKGTHLVVPAAAIESSTGLILRTKRSVLFVLPWGPHWLIGTTDTDWPYDKDNPLATAADIEYLLGEINSVLDRPVRRSDIEAVFAGLRPLVAGVGVVRGPGDMRRGDGASADVATTKLSREHAVTSPVPGLVVVSGGKYTTYRVMAVDAVDTAVRFLGLSTDLPSQTERIPLLGARNFADLWEG